MSKYTRGLTPATLLLALVSSQASAISTIDVMVVYTPGVANAYSGDPSTRINQLFSVANQIYLDSGVDLQLRLVKTLQVDYTDDNSNDIALNDITYGLGNFTNVAALRQEYKADAIVLYRPYKSVQGSCGVAWVNGVNTNGNFSSPGIKNFMYADLPINTCGDYVTAHELGHNMGLRHSRKQDGTGGTFPYALGYGVDGQFVTIMAYQSSFNADYWAGKVYKFSNPALLCKNLPCGVDRSDSQNGADAHYALNITGPQIANFYGASSAASSSAQAISTAQATSSQPKRKGSTAKEIYDDARQALASNQSAIADYRRELVRVKTLVDNKVNTTADARQTYTQALVEMTRLLKNVEVQKANIDRLQAQARSTQDAARFQQELTTLMTHFSADQQLATASYNQAINAQARLSTQQADLSASFTQLKDAQRKLADEQALTAGLSAALQEALGNYRRSL